MPEAFTGVLTIEHPFDDQLSVPMLSYPRDISPGDTGIKIARDPSLEITESVAFNGRCDVSKSMRSASKIDIPQPARMSKTLPGTLCSLAAWTCQTKDRDSEQWKAEGQP